jgi:hypothetical protein
MRLSGHFLLVIFFFLATGRGVVEANPKAVFNKAGIQNIFNAPRYSGLNTAAKEFYLSQEEKLVVALCNLARYDAHAFIREVIIPSGADTSSPEFSRMLKTLRQHKSTFPLMPAFSLYKSSLVHARDMGMSGQAGHNSSDGKSFSERIQQYFPSHTTVAENYYQGGGEPLDIVLSFLMEKGENGKEYSTNILSDKLHYIGVSIQPHRKNCNNAVLDFAQKPNIAATRNRKKDDMEVYWKDCPKGTKVSSRRKSGSFFLSSIFGRRRR